ncbi:vegetative cell wall protein gp1-like [Iris pallida]|uniref:Vegetative cell wall protein gp1-like n=1 Tax=Iris pallida TaxID=29817 RepID=A0AAX6G2E2_IRIPA|nr:vegetative cell wall protein gp1-like [Iris pallida]
MFVSTGRYGHPIHHNRIPTTHLIRRRRAAPPRVENRASPASAPPARPQGPRFCASRSRARPFGESPSSRYRSSSARPEFPHA